MKQGQDLFISIPKSLVEIAADKIRQMIISGELEFGELITELRLSSMFNLSKTPIREALLKLTVERLVQIKPRCGTAVFSLTEKDIMNISATRIVLEQGAIRSAMTHHPKELIADLMVIIEASQPLLKEYDIVRYRKLDNEYHSCLLRHTENPYLIDAYRLIFTKVMAMRNRITFTVDYMRNSVMEHMGIVAYLKDSAVNEACALLDVHINNSFTKRSCRLLVAQD